MRLGITQPCWTDIKSFPPVAFSSYYVYASSR